MLMKDLLYKKITNVHAEVQFSASATSATVFLLYFNYAKCAKSKTFSSVLQELPEILLQCEAKTKRMDCLVRKNTNSPFV